APPCEVAGQVKSRVARVLRIEHTGARSNNPFGTRIPRDTETRRKVFLIVVDEPLAEPAVTRDLDGGLESKRKAFVEIASSLPHENRVTAHVCDVRSRIDEGKLDVDQISGLVQEGWRVLVSHAVVDRHFRVDLPRIVDVVALAHRTELNLCKGRRYLGTLGISEQIIGEGVACVRSSAQ